MACELVKKRKTLVPERFRCLPVVGRLAYWGLRLGYPWNTNLISWLFAGTGCEFPSLTNHFFVLRPISQVAADGRGAPSCDAVTHILIAMVVDARYGGVVLAPSLLSAVAILIRVVQRVDPSHVSGMGTPTNELMRHLLLLTVLQQAFGFDITPYLFAAYLWNSVSMLVPFAMPHLDRSKARTATAVLGVNVVLAAASFAPATVPFVAAAFLGTHLYSFAAGCLGWRRMA